jgi:hypothetical protein
MFGFLFRETGLELNSLKNILFTGCLTKTVGELHLYALRKYSQFSGLKRSRTELTKSMVSLDIFYKL